MTNIVHERPGVYSSYDASTVVHSGKGKKTVGLAARAGTGTIGETVVLTSYAAGTAAFGSDSEGKYMAALLRLLFQNGAGCVVATRVADSGEKEEYQKAFALLEQQEDIRILVCDSGDSEIHQLLRDSATAASEKRCERIAVVGAQGENVSELIAHAKKINSERVALVGSDALDGAGNTAPGMLAAAALAGVAAGTVDPALPLNGAALGGLYGVATRYNDDEIDLLVRGGVTPLCCTAGQVSPVRAVTTRTTSGGAQDATWRELTAILIVDDVIPEIRNTLRSKFARSKNTAQTRSAIRSQVIVELEKKTTAEIIDGYGEVSVTASEEDPTVCQVDFSFAIAHGLNQIYLTAHISV